MLDQIYEAAVIPELWETVLARLSEQFQTNGAMLFRVTPRDVTWIGCGASAAGMGDLIQSGLMKRNPRLQGLLASPGDGFVTDSDFLRPGEIERLPIYQFMEARGVGRTGAATLVRGAADDALVMSLEGFVDDAAARPAINALNLLRPHLCRAAMLASQLWAQRALTVVQALQMIGVPAGVVGETGALVAANDLFSGLVGTTFLDRRNRLHLANQDADLLLVNGLRNIGPLSIPLPETEDNLATIVHLVPVRGRAHDLFSNGSVLVIVNDPSAVPGLGLNLLRGLFDLTLAESRVAQALAGGASPAEISSRAGIALHTVRTHVRSILAKTGQHRTSSLIRLLAVLSRPAPV